MTTPDHKLQARLLLSRAVPGDRLVLADATLLAALDGARALTPNERQALQASPLTLRRFRQLSLERRAGAERAAPVAANDPVWGGSGGMLRAAATEAALDTLLTDDGHWSLHFVPRDQDGGWQLILKLDAEAPFAARVLRELPMLRVVDGGGAILLQGRLDADGECERAWPFELAPMPHFQLYGGAFAVEPVRG
ncbi:hypothetical protein [Pseudoduganella namucuonensis]|uniref:Uncharacterized protein n=1 Tax=Pseudoduganella namucuonensis TaxID=1035707 RepID=A0A1I7GRW0_9BURK|nr:hypothetical protein [Pseudoduganella namucuonensis]SFU51203.1 hypothetical protein SAMN05216552_100461 [Pseudoduganella namucuonensis]